jgi:hypothetical protein
MRYPLAAIMFATIAIAPCILSVQDALSQRIQTDVYLSAETGYGSNIYLNPYVPEWDRSYISIFSAFSPAVQLRWADSKNSVTANATGYFLHLVDERDGWRGGYVSSSYSRRLTSSLLARASGGLNNFSGFRFRNVQWIQAGAEWFFSPFAKAEAHIGTGWQSVEGFGDEATIRHRNDSYRLGVEYWPGYRWRLRAQFFSGLGNITSPGDGFVSSLSATHFMQNRMAVTLRTGLEQYSQEFQMSPENGPGPIQGGVILADNGTVLTLEDRFHRTTLTVSYPLRENVSVTGTAAGLLWFSSQDDDVLGDYQVSAGVQVAFSPRRVRRGAIRSLEWNRHSNDVKIVTIRYSGDERLYITGDFNDWELPGVPLQKEGRNRYRASLELSSGVHQYKIGVRENDSLEWLEFPNEVATVSDGFGGKNGRIIIDHGE